MERGPVPPHERTWRHPSELAADERLELRAVIAPRTTRVTALAAGTFGLLVVAALVLVVTPRHQGAPIAIGSSTTSLSDFAVETTVRSTSIASVGLNRAVDLISAAVGITDSNTSTTIETSTTIAAVLAALATPVGDGSYAIVTVKALGGQRSGMVLFRLQSGDTATGRIIFELDDAAVVAMPNARTPHAIASELPGQTDMVTLMSEVPVAILFADIGRADVPEGTPVIDGNGGLVGLCSKRADGTTLLIDLGEVPTDFGDVPPSTTERGFEQPDKSTPATTLAD